MSRVAVVLVTYNRLSLLKEAIEALRIQTFKIQQIIIVNNSSTDGTLEWLSKQDDLTVITQENNGGAGGFSTGLQYCTSLGFDWIWLMDDDTICTPNALESLLDVQNVGLNGEIGFVCSKCIWTDSNPHYMNIVDIKPFFANQLPFNKYDSEGFLLAETCSFVSVLINNRAVREVGLPYKEFFIWGDDLEYTQRITRSGMLGLYSSKSIVLHKTPVNYRTDIYIDTKSNVWKYKYGYRNRYFLIRRDKGIAFYILYLVFNVIYTCAKIFIKRKDSRWDFAKTIFTSAWSSIFFNPKIINTTVTN